MKVPSSEVFKSAITLIASGRYVGSKIKSVETVVFSLLTHFMPLVSFYTPRKQKIRGFLMFSRVIERDQWHEMGLVAYS